LLRANEETLDPGVRASIRIAEDNGFPAPNQLDVFAMVQSSSVGLLQ
jgi:hypothetical protein